VLRAISRAPGRAKVSTADGERLRASLLPGAGVNARLESELVLTGATAFQESGVVEMGKGGDRFRFSTVGNGYLERTDRGERRGSAIWRIEGGDGRFEGASGTIAVLLSIDDRHLITVHQLGVVKSP
jgi:hypothetical protein